MKKRIFLSIALLIVAVPETLLAANQWPAPRGYVNDFANVISSNQAQSLELFLSEVEQKTGSQIAVVTVPTVEGADIDGAAVDLFKAWGIGKKGKDTGILLLASIQDHKARFEVGYGLESVVTDGLAGEILRQDVFPSFKQGNYGTGLLTGANAVAQLIATSQGVALGGEYQGPRRRNSGLGFWGTIILFFILFSIISALSRRGRGGYWGGGFYGGGWGGGGGGFGGGSGFGGFGGGGSGGGGASGGW